MYKVLEIAWNNDSSVLAVWSEELPSTEQKEEFVPKSYGLFSSFINPVNPNIVINILPTVLYTLPKMLTRRICSTTELGDHVLYSRDSGVILQGEFRCWSLIGIKRFIRRVSFLFRFKTKAVGITLTLIFSK